MIKWQLIPYYNTETSNIKHKWLRYFGARLFQRPDIQCSEWRLAKFILSYHHVENIIGRQIAIPIPWMRNDHGLFFRVL